MEIILAIVVASAVIFFGALISMGNERQRRAIDDLREQVALWARQDLGIKRERLTQNVQVEDPLEWFNNIVLRACGINMNLHMMESFDELPSIFFSSEDRKNHVLFSPISPKEIHSIKHGKRSKLLKYATRNPLLSLPRGLTIYEFSVLNGGVAFDLELSMAWRGLTNQKLGKIDHIWIYMT